MGGISKRASSMAIKASSYQLLSEEQTHLLRIQPILDFYIFKENTANCVEKVDQLKRNAAENGEICCIVGLY